MCSIESCDDTFSSALSVKNSTKIWSSVTWWSDVSLLMFILYLVDIVRGGTPKKE